MPDARLSQLSLEQFRVDRRASVAVTFALAMIPAFGLVGAGIDYSRASSTKSNLQASSDAAALLAASGSFAADSDRITAGVNAFNANYRPQYGTATSNVSVSSKAVTVTATANVSTMILSGLGIKSIAVSVTSTANMGNTAPVQKPGAADLEFDGIFIHGGSSLKANCGLYANSTGTNGIDFDGDSVTSASSICVVGGDKKDAQAKVSPSPTVKCTAVVDPLASLAAPSNAASSCTYNNFEVSGTATLNPGVYCRWRDQASTVTPRRPSTLASTSSATASSTSAAPRRSPPRT